jgi:hypothetical protein
MQHGKSDVDIVGYRRYGDDLVFAEVSTRISASVPQRGSLLYIPLLSSLP